MVSALKKDEETVVSAARVLLLGLVLVGLGMIGFYWLPGLIASDASGSKIIQAFYCSVITLTTIGLGDICPANPDMMGRIFLSLYPLLGLGFFCGPILDMASSWRMQVTGGPWLVVVLTLGMGVVLFTYLEELSWTESLHFSVVLGTTIGYGDIKPSTDLSRVIVAIYAMLVVNVTGGVLSANREYLESWCRITKKSPVVVDGKPDVADQKYRKKRKKSKKKKVA